MKSISRRDALRRLATVGVGLTAAACGASTGPGYRADPPRPRQAGRRQPVNGSRLRCAGTLPMRLMCRSC